MPKSIFTRIATLRMLTHQNLQKGQALVVLLLILVVTLTVGLSVIARTVTNVKESSTTERSSRAFEAAEAGIESTLRQDIPSLIPSGQNSVSLNAISVGGAQSNITISKSGSTTGIYQPAKPVAQDDVIQLDIDQSHCSGCTVATSLDVYWSLKNNTQENPAGSSCTPPAAMPASLEISIVTFDGTNYGVSRSSPAGGNYNANSCPSLAASNGFITAGTDNSLNQFVSKQTISLPASGKLIRIRPLYNSATIRMVTPNGQQIPVQSYTIRSEGVSGDTKRVVQVERSIGGLPSIFDYVLFNGSATTPLTKN